MMVRRNKVLLLAFLLSALLLAAGCGKKAAAPADMEALWTQMQDRAELPPMRPLSAKRMMDRYGIDAQAHPQVVVMVSEESLRVDEIWLIEAADEEQAKTLCTAAENRIGQLRTETENYLPDQFAVLGSAQVLRHGNQMALIISPEAETLAEIFEKAVG